MKSPPLLWNTGTAVFSVRRHTTMNDLLLKQLNFPICGFGVCTNIWGNQILISINPQMWFQPLKLAYCKPWSWNGREMSSMFPKRLMFCFTRGSNLGGRHMTITSRFISSTAKREKTNKQNTRAKTTNTCAWFHQAVKSSSCPGVGTNNPHIVPIRWVADAESLGAERLIGVERRDRRSGGLHQTSRILSLGRNAVVERSLAEPPADPGGSWGVQHGVRLVGDGEEGKRWGKDENKPAGSFNLFGGS